MSVYGGPNVALLAQCRLLTLLSTLIGSTVGRDISSFPLGAFERLPWDHQSSLVQFHQVDPSFSYRAVELDALFQLAGAHVFDGGRFQLRGGLRIGFVTGESGEDVNVDGCRAGREVRGRCQEVFGGEERATGIGIVGGSTQISNR